MAKAIESITTKVPTDVPSVTWWLPWSIAEKDFYATNCMIQFPGGKVEGCSKDCFRLVTKGTKYCMIKIHL